MAEHMQKAGLLLNFIRAHIGAQEMLLKYFGRQGTADSVEICRCLLQSQLSVYKAINLYSGEKKNMNPSILEQARVAQEALRLSVHLEDYITDVYRNGVFSEGESHDILIPIHEHLSEFMATLHDLCHGRLLHGVTIQQEEITPVLGRHKTGTWDAEREAPHTKADVFNSTHAPLVVRQLVGFECANVNDDGTSSCQLPRSSERSIHEADEDHQDYVPPGGEFEEENRRDSTARKIEDVFFAGRDSNGDLSPFNSDQPSSAARTSFESNLGAHFNEDDENLATKGSRTNTSLHSGQSLSVGSKSVQYPTHRLAGLRPSSKLSDDAPSSSSSPPREQVQSPSDPIASASPRSQEAQEATRTSNSSGGARSVDSTASPALSMEPAQEPAPESCSMPKSPSQGVRLPVLASLDPAPDICSTPSGGSFDNVTKPLIPKEEPPAPKAKCLRKKKIKKKPAVTGFSDDESVAPAIPAQPSRGVAGGKRQKSVRWENEADEAPNLGRPSAGSREVLDPTSSVGFRPAPREPDVPSCSTVTSRGSWMERTSVTLDTAAASASVDRALPQSRPTNDVSNGRHASPKRIVKKKRRQQGVTAGDLFSDEQ